LVDDNGNKSGVRWVLRADGFVAYPTPDPNVTEYFRWTVRSDELILGEDDDGWSAPIVKTLVKIVNKYPSVLVSYGQGEERYRVVHVDTDRIVLEDVENAERGTLRRSFGPADFWPHGVVAQSPNTFNPIRPFGSVVIESEEINVTAEDPVLHYPDGKTVPVNLGDAGSMKVVRNVWRSADGGLSVDYDLPVPPPHPTDGP